MQNNTEIIINKIKEGDEKSYNLLFQKYYRRLHFFAFQYVKESGAAENMVQDTFVTLWRKKESLICYDENGLLSWLYTVLKNNCYHYLKKAKENRTFSNLINIDQLDLDLEGLKAMDTSESFFNDISKIIQDTLETLPPQCRKVFEMSRFEGLKNREIAAQLNITEKAVEGNISRALKIFRISLKEYLPQVLLFLNL